MATTTKVARKVGRPRRSPAAEKYTVTLPPALGEWGKEQPEGLSGLLSALLKAERARRAAENAPAAENAARFATLSMEPAHHRFWDSPEEDDAWEGM